MICHPASTTHSGIKAEERKALGITEGTIRLSIGVEDPSDLLADIEQAMAGSLIEDGRGTGSMVQAADTAGGDRRAGFPDRCAARFERGKVLWLSSHIIHNANHERASATA